MSNIIATKSVFPAREMVTQRRAMLADTVFAKIGSTPPTTRSRSAQAKFATSAPVELGSTVISRR